jgi:hypothetical protein
VGREGDTVSYPVDADLRTAREFWVGGIDGKDRDVIEQALNGTTYAGAHYLGGGMAPAFHTWSIRGPENALLTLEYHAVPAGPPALAFLPLKAARLIRSAREGGRSSFTFRVLGAEAIVAVTCPAGFYSVDAMHLRLQD